MTIIRIFKDYDQILETLKVVIILNLYEYFRPLTIFLKFELRYALSEKTRLRISIKMLI